MLPAVGIVQPRLLLDPAHDVPRTATLLAGHCGVIGFLPGDPGPGAYHTLRHYLDKITNSHGGSSCGMIVLRNNAVVYGTIS